MNNLYTLDQICKKITDGSHQSPKEDPTGYPMVSVKDMTEFGFDLSKAKHISKNDFEKLVKQGCKPEVDDILIAKDGSVMKHIFRVRNADNIVLLSSIAILRPNKEIVYPDFLVYSLKNNRVKEDILNNYVSGSGVPRIVLKDFKKVELDIPNLDLQINISKKLRSLDDKIELNTQINQTLEQIAQALFKSWFVDFDPVRAKVQALSDGLSLEQAELAAMQAISGKTAEELTALSQTQPDRYAELAETAKAFPCEMVEVDGVEVPKGWTFQYLKDICNIVYGKGLPKTKLTNTGYRVFGANGVIGYYSEFMYKNPQILIGCRGTVGQVTVSTPFSFITNNSLIIEYENSLINRYYLEHYLRTLNLKEISSGSVQLQITIQNMSGVKLLTPNRETLSLYEINVKDIYETMYQNQIENEKLTKVRDLLLPKLLSGEI